MNITVEIKAPEIANAILVLAAALSGNQTLNLNGKEVAVASTPEPAQQHVPVTQATPEQATNVVPFQQQPAPTAVPTAPMQQPVQQAPVQQAQAVPTSAPTYTMDQLAVAATQLMDAGRQPELLALLQSFGVPSLMALPKEQYGAFATSLRGMGANI
ncbi:hypothetical protein [Neobacillus drentensis]|uniref:hypothetical protein n=1 Tax=Neobacillus drentensis TaxID=220684 RepID=UPI0028630744|nr:hypothetical protein [Neobacillus drentensis]MDR7237167.1 hypothetical protein [Neobacillus drentensis]